MLIKSRCGITCSDCGYRETMNCPTCTVMEAPFWGESCPVKTCVEEKGIEHCGACTEIPCELLTEMAFDTEQGDNGLRIQNCQTWYAQELKETLSAYALSKPGVTTDYKEEWGWDRFMVGEKLFLSFALMKEKDPMLTLKLEPLYGDTLRQQYPELIIPGYYMNKEHWNTIFLEHPWSLDFLISLVDQAYSTVLGSLSKKKQTEILGK